MSKGFKTVKWAGHVVGPSHPIHCRGNTLFKNSHTENRKCSGAQSCMNRKWILVCISTTCNNEYIMDLSWFARHPQFSSQSGTHCSDVQLPALKLKMDTSSISFIILDAETRKPRWRFTFIHLFLYCDVDPPSAVLAAQFSSILCISYQCVCVCVCVCVFVTFMFPDSYCGHKRDQICCKTCCLLSPVCMVSTAVIKQSRYRPGVAQRVPGS